MPLSVCSQRPLLFSIVGQDAAADAVRASLHAAGLQSHALTAKPGVATASCLTLVDAGIARFKVPWFTAESDGAQECSVIFPSSTACQSCSEACPLFKQGLSSRPGLLEA